MPRLRVVLAASALVALCAGSAGAVVALDTPSAAAAASALCEQYGRTTTADGRYVVQNNRWGTGAQQCIEPTATGFRLSTAEGDVPTNGAPASYPSVYWGCHYSVCTPGFDPVPASSAAFSTVRTSVRMSYPSTGSWDASYDLWFDPTARRDGQNTGAEVMVWLNHAGAPQPIGSKVGVVTLGGADWDVWFGTAGWNVVSYVRRTPTTTADFAVATFFDDAVRRGYAQRSWYLTSVQAGFEPWQGGAGLAVTDFTAGPPGGTATTSPTPTATPAPTTSPVPGRPRTTTPATPTTAPAASPTAQPVSLTCTATRRVDSAWDGGLVATTTVTNGPGARTAWTTRTTLPAGQRVTNLWNGSWRQDGQVLTVSNLPYNGTLAAGAGTSFGFQVAATPGTATGAAPSGTTCA